MKKSQSKRMGYIAALCATTALTAPGVANAVIDEMTVTATRRAQSVQDIPYNISAFSGEDLARSGVGDLSDLSRIVPGVTFIDQGPRPGANNNGFIIRGLNAGALTDSADVPQDIQPPVSTYLGETPLFFPLKLIDVERVEVLRGPQGTLYGSGSVGGTLRIIPNKPSTEGFTYQLNGQLSFTDESDEENWEGSGVVNIPFSDRAALRAYIGREHLGGFVDFTNLAVFDPATGAPALATPGDFLGSGIVTTRKDDANDSETTFGRASLLLDITDNAELVLNYHYQKTESDGRYVDGGFDPSTGDYETAQPLLEPQESEIQVYNADLDIDLGFANLSSSTSFSKLESTSTNDGSGFYGTSIPAYYFYYPRIVVSTEGPLEEDTFTQEIRLASNSDGPIDWILGAYYLKKDTEYLAPDIMFGYGGWLDAYLGAPSGVSPNNATVFETIIDREFTDMALFGELTFNITDQWQITGGVRTFKQKTKGVQGTTFPALSQYYTGGADPSLLDSVFPIDKTVKDTVFKFNTSYDINEDTMAYFTWAEGFRRGGANALPATGPFAADDKVYKSDTATNWEAGVKGTLADMLSYSAAAFYIQWEDVQIQNFTASGLQFIDNGPDSISKGIELEVQANLLEDRMPVSIGYAYTDTETDEDFVGSVGPAAKGRPLPGSAEHTLTWAADYIHPMGGDADLVFHVNGSYRSEVYTAIYDPALNPRSIKLDSWGVWDLSMSYQKPNWNISLFADNVTNELGTTFATPDFVYGTAGARRGVIRPRTIGVRFTFNGGASE